MTPDFILRERPKNGVLLLRLNRPERRNALATSLLTELAVAMTEAGEDETIRAVVITGGDSLFAAGADLSELAASSSDDLIESPRYHAWQVIRAFPKPLLAAVEGWCLGAGAELMMCCDIVIAGESSRFGQPETNLGIMPGAGGTATLTRLVGRALAMRMVLTGDPINAATALGAGLIAEVVPTGSAIGQAVTLAHSIAGRAPLALREAKASIKEASSLAEPDHIRAERTRFIALLGSADMVEGIAAFQEKRAARWKGI